MEGIAVPLIVSVIVAAIGVPVAVDAHDVGADHPLYGIERAGEQISRLFVEKTKWELNRADERLAEFEEMWVKGKAQEFLNLLEEHRRHVSRLKGLTHENVFNLVMAMIEKHKEVLENVLENVPEEAVPAIEHALEMSQKCKDVLIQRFPVQWGDFEMRRQEMARRYQEWRARKPWVR